MYMVLDEDVDGNYEAKNLGILTEGFHSVATASAEQTARAQASLWAMWENNPAERYVDLNLEATRAADSDGDYVGCILKAAAAAEVLIKHAAWTLTWEATAKLSIDPRPDAASISKAAGAKPSDLIGSVLMPRLRGNWNSRLPISPVGAWRQNIAKQRNAVIHRGYNPSSNEAYLAVESLGLLERHLVDRLAVMANIYPRTALMLAGKEALERRGEFGKARATFLATDLHADLREYLSWLDKHVEDDAG